MKKFLCPTCIHASHDWCNVRPDIFEAQTECSRYNDGKRKKRVALVEIVKCTQCPDMNWLQIPTKSRGLATKSHSLVICGLTKRAASKTSIPEFCPKKLEKVLE